MVRKLHYWCYMIALLSIPFSVSSSFNSTSGGRDDILHVKASIGRTILQAKQDCPINVETLNYTNMKSQCKKPFEVQPCCSAFKELACPYKDELNDLTNDCATRLFKYFDFLQYPDGLFSNICIETKEGLPCPATPPQTSADANADQRSSIPFQELMILAPTFLLLLRF